MIPPQLDIARVELSLRPRSRSVLLLLVAGCSSLLLAAGLLWVGISLSFQRLSVGRRLLAVDPGNPRLEYRLGRIYEDTDSAEAIRHLRRATELSPLNPRYWSHLAFACESKGDATCAD